MFIISLLLLVVVVSLLESAEQHKSSVVVCNSISCTWNKLCRCTRRAIAIYDNTVKGLCLYHTEDIKERIFDPMREKRMIESSEFSSEMMDKIMKAQEDKLLKDPNAFAGWLRKQGRWKRI